MTVVVRARPQRVARSAGGAPRRASRAASEARYVAQPVCAGVRHSRACFSGESGAGGLNAAQRWSRDGRSSRQPPASARRNGQPRGSRAVGDRAGGGSGGRRRLGARSSDGRGAGVGARRVRDRPWSSSRRAIADRDRAAEIRRKAQDPGDDLFSRKAALSVSSALESLTSVFGMGTGMASPLASPGSCCWM